MTTHEAVFTALYSDAELLALDAHHLLVAGVYHGITTTSIFVFDASDELDDTLSAIVGDDAISEHDEDCLTAIDPAPDTRTEDDDPTSIVRWRDAVAAQWLALGNEIRELITRTLLNG